MHAWKMHVWEMHAWKTHAWKTHAWKMHAWKMHVCPDLLQLSFRCLAPYGRFIELGKRDFTVNSRLEMAWFAKNVSYIAVDLGLYVAAKPDAAQRTLDEVMGRYDPVRCNSNASTDFGFGIFGSRKGYESHAVWEACRKARSSPQYG
jgi:hypothetical protein